ncbi:SDR family NAD(P)-dependent oxidoreductase [Mycolicibacterium confluentis]|uniref:Short-chain dehydrogenase n=2 Tax=Mycolicibacterium confluentis TaxID=28047 RepID=A0A7I7Y5Q2_9MYCO|nr:SDR family oxidoreductase [Mycolicibacterium confluentis]MCV7322665.1 SDR family oxidoreductase [Mycolicibacterium confluentis]ORV29800.1 hypothetical protein AWB99_16645 [Mycolicibacterium confluentis]BBZ36433.1 short-chain dehydrogenase [Mycolicibacterium confluentis]
MTADETRVALVTGGNSGIGLATAQLLNERGYAVAICGRDAGRLETAVNETGAKLAVQADVSDRDAAYAAVEEVVGTLGRLDALVNAHGILGAPTPLADLTPEQWHTMLNINLLGPIWTTTAATAELSKTQGAVVNVASINAIQAEQQMAPYGVSKAGLVGFTKYAAADLAPMGIRVNAVLPGWVHTPMAAPHFEEAGVTDGRMSTNYMGRAASPRELAQVIAFLLSKEASFVTGAEIVADGGHWIKMQDLAPLTD